VLEQHGVLKDNYGTCVFVKMAYSNIESRNAACLNSQV